MRFGTLTEAGLTKDEQIQLAIKVIVENDGNASMPDIYEGINNELAKRNYQLSRQGEASLRRVVNDTAVQLGYIYPHDEKNPGWRATPAGEAFFYQSKKPIDLFKEGETEGLRLNTLIRKLAQKLKVVKTLSTEKSNWITKVDEEGIYVETESSREKHKFGEKAEPWELLTFEFIYRGWEEFNVKRSASANDFVKTRGRTSFLMALFAQLPFVQVVSKENTSTISLIEFKTDELPNEQIHKVITFLEEVINGTYHPEELSSEVEGNLYRVKSRARQDLRLLGFLNESHQKNEMLFERYVKAQDKIEVLRELILEKEYFRIALTVLGLLSGESPSTKKEVLVELGRLIVRNSRGDNLMVESVAMERTQNLLMWLQYVNLIDDNCDPLIELNEYREKVIVNSNLHNQFLYIMNNYIEARQQSFAGNPMGSVLRNDVPREIRSLPFINSNYTITGSVGQGNWAVVPWVAIMNSNITTSTQRGYYIVYLFSEDMKRLYLTLAQGVTESTREEMAVINQEIRSEIKMDPKVKKDDQINLGPSKRARDYAYSTAAYIMYSVDDMPAEEELVSDLEKMTSYYERYIELKSNQYPVVDPGAETVAEDRVKLLSSPEVIEHVHSYITSKGFYYEKEEVTNFFYSLKTKPFVILSGISGTGKTKIVQWFAESVGATEENGQFALIPVRPDWSDGSDLLGYTDIKGEFKEGPLTSVLKKAIDDPERPYFVLLDEMNLARVEHYFSDLLSVMESRKWEEGRLVTSTVLSDEMAGREIYLPANVYIIGTVNMDETTHPFSKKVLDRANTLEFNRVKLDYLQFLQDREEMDPVVLHNGVFATKYLHLKDVYSAYPELVEEVTSVLVEINNLLQINGSHVGYRVRDEICFYLAYNEESKVMERKAALDHCILQKILPRLAGSDTRIERVLKALFKLFTNKEIEYAHDAALEDVTYAVYPKSAEKVLEMIRRLEDDGFTSFWISS
jgi:MoxR-like ATPase